MATITKTPFEQFAYALDFSAKLENGETLATASVTAKTFLGGTDTTAEVIASNPAPAISGTTVVFTVTGGQVGEKHLIEVEVTTSAGSKYEGGVHLEITEAT